MEKTKDLESEYIYYKMSSGIETHIATVNHKDKTITIPKETELRTETFLKSLDIKNDYIKMGYELG